ncbi:hypothetical protein JAAARDRAFT_193108 [Jaapia argillacea MUCL 33604]|uniref:GDP/GTP exchange factor Sec2 N-terminal domain-containing protein n=1 Tax=Jaapia argillacea MUCL 33604 TaxID=933084 RepID=A0A067PV14_9AGAM|nr:hypothetical protein JAAARDRAFT_193108 [Jaapia argillacea MUCL 33604]
MSKLHKASQDQAAQQDFTSGPTGPATGRSGINDQGYGQDNSYQQPTGPAGGVGGQGGYGAGNMAGVGAHHNVAGHTSQGSAPYNTDPNYDGRANVAHGAQGEVEPQIPPANQVTVNTGQFLHGGGRRVLAGKVEEAKGTKMQASELDAAERLEREAMMRHERAVAHGAHPDNRHLGGHVPGNNQQNPAGTLRPDVMTKQPGQAGVTGTGMIGCSGAPRSGTPRDSQAARRGQAETARADIEKELDDLSAHAFDQANTMVAEARLARAISKSKVVEAELALKGAEEAVAMMLEHMQTMQGDKEAAERAAEEMKLTMDKGKLVERSQSGPGHPSSRLPGCRLILAEGVLNALQGS